MKVVKLQAPNKRVLGALKQMFTQGGCRILDGRAREYLGQEYESDLIALKSPSEDVLSNILRKKWAVKVNYNNILERLLLTRYVGGTPTRGRATDRTLRRGQSHSMGQHSYHHCGRDIHHRTYYYIILCSYSSRQTGINCSFHNCVCC